MTEQRHNTTTNQDNGKRRVVTANNALLVTLNIGSWSARKYDRALSNEVARNHGANAEEIGRFNKITMQADALEELQKLGREARQRHYELTLAWDDNNNRVISADGYLDWAAEMQEFKRKHDDLLPRFVANYPALVEEQRRRLNGTFNEADYPENIDARFRFYWSVRKIEEASDFRCKLGAGIEEQIRADIESRVSNQWEAAHKELIDRVTEAVTHIRDRLQDYTKAKQDGRRTQFHASVTDNLAGLIDCLPALNVTGDPKLAAICDQARATLCKHDADTLKVNETARVETIAKAKETLDTIAGMYA